MRVAETYRYTVPVGSDELVGELLTDVIDANEVQSIDSNDREQVKELAHTINEFGASHEVSEEPLELARMVVASRVYGWLPKGSDTLYDEWQKVHASYAELNGDAPTPAVLMKVTERHEVSEEPYGYYMSLNASDALMLDHIKISDALMFEPSLRSRYEGYGKLFLGHGRNVPSTQTSHGLQGEQLLRMLLESGHTAQPVSDEEHDSWSGSHTATLHYALGKQAVLALPDYLKNTGRFTDEILLEELGKMGIPLRHSELHRGHQFDDAGRTTQTEGLRQRMLASLLIAGSIMTHDVRGQVALYDIDAAALVPRLEQDFATVERVAPFIRQNNSRNYRSLNGAYKPPVKEIKGVSVELEAWEREADGFDKELVEHALGIYLPF